MALTYKVLGQLEPVTDTQSILYTVPTGAGNYAIVSTLNVCNLGSLAGTFSVAVSPAGASINDKHYILKDAGCNAKQTQSYTIGITLAATDVIRVTSSNGEISFNLFGSENS
jgi:hypothetical protein